MQNMLEKLDNVRAVVAEVKDTITAKDFLARAKALDKYAKEAKNRELEIHALELRMRLERRVGELMKAQRDAGLLSEGGRPLKTGLINNPVSPTLADAGIDKNLAHTARKLAAIPDGKFESKITKKKEQMKKADTVDDLKDGSSRYTKNSGKYEWYTPPEFVELARTAMKGIDLDPASSEDANTIVKAAVFYDEITNGLDKPWVGNVWMNPPYAAGIIDDFCAKWVHEFKGKNIKQGVVLVNNSTDTQWFQNLAVHSSAIAFSKRIKFLDCETLEPSKTPLQGQVFLYFGKAPKRFCSVFEKIGITYSR